MAKPLGQLLIEDGYVTEAQLQEALEKRGDADKKLGQQLVDMEYITQEELMKVLQQQLGVSRIEISAIDIDPELSEYIPENISRRHQVVPVEIEDNKLKVAMTDPSDVVAIDDVEMVSPIKIEPYIATPREIREAQGLIYSDINEDTAEVIENLNSFQEQEEPEPDELEEMVDDAPIVRLTNIIINRAVKMRASDVHIEPQKRRVRVRYRVDGVLQQNMTAPKHSQAALVSRLKIMANLDITKRRVPQDGRVRINMNGIEIDLRVSTIPTIHGEKVVIRLLNQDDELLNIEKLGFSDHNLERFKRLINQPNGIVLLTGPTGSGKSTTLFAALNRLNTIQENIVTIEDPVEYQIEGINQIQANKKTGLTFASTLRSILRQDPDIIMVGEIRDTETAQIAIRAALTGHLVLSTLHTNDAVSSITRLLDMGIPSYLVAATINGVVAQRLVRRLCNACKQEYQPGLEEREMLNLGESETLYKAGECAECNYAGYRGRVAVQEVLVLNDEIKEMVVREEEEQQIKKTALNQGMTTLKQDGINKVVKGLTSYNEMAKIIV